MRGVSATSSGVSDIPMRLMIAAILTSIAIPAFIGAYGDLSTNLTVSHVESELTGLLSSVDRVMSGGNGSTLEIELEVRSWGSSHINGIKIGGSLENRSDPERYLIEYDVEGYGKGMLALDPPIAMGDPENSYGVDLTGGIHRLKIVHSVIDGENVALILVY